MIGFDGDWISHGLPVREGYKWVNGSFDSRSTTTFDEGVISFLLENCNIDYAYTNKKLIYYLVIDYNQVDGRLLKINGSFATLHVGIFSVLKHSVTYINSKFI